MSRSLSRAARLRKIENLLFHHADGMRVQELAELCSVNRRTIYRDIDLLTDAGVPVWQNEGRYGIIRDQYLATIRLHFNEAVALYIASRLLARHADEHNPHIVSALNKLATAFPDPLSEYIARTATNIRQQPINPTFVQILETITKSWAENHKVAIWYRSPRSNKLRKRTLAPYHIEPSSTGGLYVIGFDDWAKDIRTFKLERLERAEQLPETFEPPSDFSPADHFKNAWGIMSGDDPITVKLLFSPAVAAFIQERIWHPSELLEKQSDGSILMQLHVAEPKEMRPWIKSWGAEVEVLAPESLRSYMIAEVQRLMELYS